MTEIKYGNSIEKPLRQARNLLWFSVVFIVAAPFIFTRASFWSEFDFNKTGNIGDTIGGITAPVASLIGAVLVYYALKAQIKANQIIQIQINEQRKKDALALSLSQFQIYSDELKEFLQEGKSMKFENNLNGFPFPLNKDDFTNSSGIYYLNLFSCLGRAGELKESPENIGRFRVSVMFPLERYYDRLFYFLDSVYQDEILQKIHKNIIYNKAERDILQIYFRLCNTIDEDLDNSLYYNLSNLNSQVYRVDKFYRINEFFIKHGLFQYKDLQFYKNAN